MILDNVELREQVLFFVGECVGVVSFGGYGSVLVWFCVPGVFIPNVLIGPIEIMWCGLLLLFVIMVRLIIFVKCCLCVCCW